MSASTSTRSPMRYVTGGEFHLCAALQDCELSARDQTAAYPAAIGCGPLDAPDFMPTGGLTVSHGRRFYHLTHRED